MQRQDRCAEPPSHWLTLDQALERMRGALRPIMGIEWVPLNLAHGRILAEDIPAPLDLPPFPNAAMDGYAVRWQDLHTETPLQVIGTSRAGHPFPGALSPGECIRIFTGAAIPTHADTVVAQEDVVREGDKIRVPVEVRAGDHVRPRGDEIQAGQRLLRAGKRLAAADLGLLASIGLPETAVRRRLRVAFFSTGDELRPVWQPLGPGAIHESNRYVMAAQLADPGVEPIDFGTVPDDKDTIRQVLLEASNTADAVLASGGVSVGEADFIVDILRDLGEIDFWKVAIKPGKPFAFGAIGSACFCGLPGNPVAVMVTFRQLVRPALLHLMAAEAPRSLRFPAVCENRLVKTAGRLEFQRGVYRRHENGHYTVAGLTGQGSHLLTSMSWANCFIVLPMENTGVEPGETVEIEPFGESF